MTEPVEKALGYASWDPRGYYHYHEVRGGAFISKERFLSILRPSLGGYHGALGRFIPYNAIAQILGPGVPTTAHEWWRTMSELPAPTQSIDKIANIQYRVNLTVMDRDGNVTTHQLYTPIAQGYSVSGGDQMVDDFIKTGTGSPPIELEPEEELEEIGRTFTEIKWEPTFGIGPRPRLGD